MLDTRNADTKSIRIADIFCVRITDIEVFVSAMRPKLLFIFFKIG